MTKAMGRDELPISWRHSDVVAERLVTDARERVVTGTWLNHWSIQRARADELRRFEFIGTDGTLLQWLLTANGQRTGRSSADLVIPRIIARDPSAPIALIGAAPGVAQEAMRRNPAWNVVYTCDGFEELRGLRGDYSRLVDSGARIVVLGLGTPLQEEVALEVAAQVDAGLVLTGGGWIDQLAAKEAYFPPIVHTLRVGWLWRLAHEPRRLGRRYTVDAVSAVLQRREFHTLLKTIAAQVGTLGWRGRDAHE